MGQNIRHHRFLANDGATLNDSLVTTPHDFPVLDHECGFGRSAYNLRIEDTVCLKDDVDVVEMSDGHFSINPVLPLAELGKIIETIR